MPTSYAPSTLRAVERRAMREGLGISERLPFVGTDLWTAWELSWLGPRGKPETAIVRLEIPADSPRLVESKSLKLYLGSFVQSVFAGRAAVRRTLESDLARTVGARVSTRLLTLDAVATDGIQGWRGASLDAQEIEARDYTLRPDVLRLDGRGEVSEALYSNLLRTICPVTFQPDVGSVYVGYEGPRIDHAALLQYLVSFRLHPGFHEETVERIFTDLQARCQPASLTVAACFLRRGGIDINPLRSTHARTFPSGRQARQ